MVSRFTLAFGYRYSIIGQSEKGSAAEDPEIRAMIDSFRFLEDPAAADPIPDDDDAHADTRRSGWVRTALFTFVVLMILVIVMRRGKRAAIP